MAKKSDPSFIEDLSEKLERAKAMAFVLADAAGGDLGVEPDNVHHVSLMIAREVEQAHAMIQKHFDTTQQKRAAS